MSLRSKRGWGVEVVVEREYVVVMPLDTQERGLPGGTEKTTLGRGQGEGKRLLQYHLA